MGAFFNLSSISHWYCQWNYGNILYLILCCWDLNSTSWSRVSSHNHWTMATDYQEKLLTFCSRLIWRWICLFLNYAVDVLIWVNPGHFFVYFCPFLIPIPTAVSIGTNKLKKESVLRIRTQCNKMVSPDKTTEPRRPPNSAVVGAAPI